MDVCINDIVGQKLGKTSNVLQSLDELFNEDACNYSRRSISMLNYTSENVIRNLKDSFQNEPITLSEINKGKYCIKDNGRHRCTLLKLHYLNELEKRKDIISLKEKYTIPALVEELDIEKTYSKYLIHLSNALVDVEEELDEKNHKTGNVVIIGENDECQVLNNDGLLEYMKKSIKNIPRDILENVLPNIYNRDENFKNFVDINLKDSIIYDFYHKHTEGNELSIF
jgi:hypothetical protein